MNLQNQFAQGNPPYLYKKWNKSISHLPPHSTKPPCVSVAAANYASPADTIELE